MRVLIQIIFSVSVLACKSDLQESRSAPESENILTESQSLQKPKVSFTFDDGITQNLASYEFSDWNQMILTALEEAGLTSVFFVTGRNKLDDKGRYLLQSWSDQGHVIANHTFTHPNFNNPDLDVADFERELLQTDRVINGYSSYAKLFRFPYLKEGNTKAKITGYRNVLDKHDYQNGSVTIDASDWYINAELIKYIQKEGPNAAKVETYKSFYLQHILERAKYYENLSYRQTNRNIPHTLLLHHNLSSALFLDELIDRFKEEGWEVIDADRAFEDEIYDRRSGVNPAGESLIWSLAKESGNYDDELRYPAEDSRYEIPKMKALGIL